MGMKGCGVSYSDVCVVLFGGVNGEVEVGEGWFGGGIKVVVIDWGVGKG